MTVPFSVPGSAWDRTALQALPAERAQAWFLFPAQSRGRASTAVRSQAEPGTERVNLLSAVYRTRDTALNLLVFSDDWGLHPSSCQHLIRHLLGQYSVTWVNTIGTCPPGFDWGTVKRGLQKVGQWGWKKNLRVLPPGLKVVAPIMWPWFRSRLDRQLNRLLLGRRMVPMVRSLQRPVVAVTTIPIVADLMGLLPVDRWVYYCVDDFAEWPRLDGPTMRTMERDVVAKADLLVAVSNNLQEKIEQQGREASLLTHGVDLDLWQSERGRDDVPQLRGLERPLIVFWGAVDRRLDLAFVQRLSQDLTKGTVVFLGPESFSDPALLSIHRVARIPPVAYELLPCIAQESAVLIMPYADLPVTRAMQPLKLKEYLATGKPTVVRDLPANREWSDCLDLTATPAEFAAAVLRRLESGLPDEQKAARSRLAAESWETKAQLFSQILESRIHADALAC